MSPVKDLITSIQATKQTAITSQADVLLADAKGSSWLQRTWRPFLGFSLAFILIQELFVVRLLNIIFAIKGSEIRLEYRTLPDEYWVLVIAVATVFGGGRTWHHLRRSKFMEERIAKSSRKKRRRKAKP